jgi:dihydrofolate reductase
MKSDIIIIVAASNNNCIGKDNDLPWHLPSDLKMFKEVTNGHVVLMGRNTWESIPEKFRPLKNRTNVVITRNLDYIAEGAEVRHDLQDALDEFSEDKSVFVIGGAQIYKEAFSRANKLYLTRVMHDVAGDTFLEGLVESDWLITSFEGPLDEGGYKYRFDKYIRK